MSATDPTRTVRDASGFIAAQCPHCPRVVRIRADGRTLYTHGPRDAQCPGSRQPYAPANPTATDPTETPPRLGGLTA